jgi:hypothetical protein
MCLCLHALKEYGDDKIKHDDVKNLLNDAYTFIRSTTTKDSFVLYYIFCFNSFLFLPEKYVLSLPCF